MKNQTATLALFIILAGVVARVIGAEMHWYNLAPVAAIGLFSGSVIQDKKWAFLTAIAAQFIVDMYFEWFTKTQGFYGIAQLFTYAGLIAATFLGTFLKNRKALPIAGFSLLASLVFFIISNLGFFLQGWNGYSLTGFVKTFVDAIPFFKTSVLGDLLGSATLFGLFALLTTVMRKQKMHVA